MGRVGNLPVLAYLTTAYPSVSHTFIRREIQGLERLGYTIHRIAIRPGQAVVDPEDQEELKKTLHLLEHGLIRIALLAFQGLLSARVRAFHALLQAWQLSKASDRGLFRHVAYLAEALALLPMLRRREVDHVHVHFGTNAAAVAMLIKTLGGPTFSMTVHGPDEFDAPIGLSLGWKVREALFTVAISHFCMSQLRRWVGDDQWDKIHIVRCTVGEEWFQAARPVDENAFSIVSIGRLSAQKGQLVLIDAFARAVESGFRGKLILVGDGEMRISIEQRIVAKGIQEQVDLVGWCSGSETRGYLLNSRALVLTSFAEGLPVVIMEAMAIQRPVLSTWIMGVPELVKVGNVGWLVAPSEIEHLAEEIIRIQSTPLEDIRTMGRNAFDLARRECSVEVSARKLNELFTMVASQR